MKESTLRRRAQARGAAFVQYLVLVAFVVGAVLLGARALGAGTADKSGKLATCIQSLDGTCGGDSISLGSGAATGQATTTTGETQSALDDSSSSPDPVGSPQSADPTAAVVADPGASYDASEAASYGPAKGPENYDNKKEVPIKGTLFVKMPGDTNAVSPNDVGQGQLGDCWLMSSLAAVAFRSPSTIEGNMKANPKGGFSVRIFDDTNKSHWQTVTGKFPIDKRGEVAYARPVEGTKKDGAELWVPVYERAMAKNAGGYTQIDGGDPGAGMAMITGQPSEYMKSKKTSFSTFSSYFEHGYAMAAGTPDEKHATDKLFKNDTLISGHAYWIQAVDTKAQTVTVRNPWGVQFAPVTLPWKTFQRVFPDAMANPITPRKK